MFLSRVLIAPNRTNDSYHFHQDLWKLFEKDDNKTRDFLFRVEKNDLLRGCQVLLQSQREPLDGTRNCEILAKKEIQWNPKEGDFYQFMLAANPTKKIWSETSDPESPKKEKPSRVPLVKDEDLQDWLHRKTAPFAKLLDARCRPEGSLYFRKEKHRGKISIVTFEGMLQITDRKAFLGALCLGIGPAKAFGCGLLSVARR